MPVPVIPESLRKFFDDNVPGFWNWWQSFRTFVDKSLSTEQDFRCITSGKGIVLKNAAGTVTKRIRLNDAGDGIIFEDL